ncbi:Spermidine hydroxycinnamoyl transferase [Sesamum angolense]|uniref:Spermidine hydroxycinnamoyl transferase n=1 Tax=Sesamum angolense TaxID=2727404 RepID=A0AAE1T896_9LAMI|nr:Spermidine hydroxycinnamoyl transferase [Sesamum angolense]
MAFQQVGSCECCLRIERLPRQSAVAVLPTRRTTELGGGGGSRVELHCNGKGVRIFEAESEGVVEDFGDFTPTPAIQALIPSWIYTTPIDEIPLVIVQVTRFRCGGLSIGLGISHVMADGPSALHFIDEWTKFARGVGPVIPPFLDRKALETEKPVHCKFDPSVLRPPPTLLGQEDSLEQRKKPISVAFLSLTKLQIEKLRGKANLDFYKENGSEGSRGYSRFEAVAALAVHQQGPWPHRRAANKPPLRRRFPEQNETSSTEKLLRERPDSSRSNR